jgi:hypothetical protein
VLLLLLVVLAGVGLGASASAGAGSVGGQESALTFAATLDGQPLGLSSTGDPIVIDPDSSSTLALAIRNNTAEPITVRQVQLRGTAFGLTLLSYDVVVNATIASGDRTRVDVPVEFFDLGDQVTGLLPATIRLLDPDRDLLASRDFTVDVRGSATSLMAIFTIVVAIATGVSILLIWIAIGRRRLPRSRWQRGVRFALVGAGIGVTLTLFLALLLLVTPEGGVWIPLLVVPTVGAFLLGWFSPGPLADLEEETEIEDWMRETVPFEPNG